MRSITKLALAAILAAACSGPSPPVAAKKSALTADQCTYFDVNGKVSICHKTSSPKNPYTIVKISEQGCINGHAAHTGDYVTSTDPNSPLYDPKCQGQGCLPVGAPCDATLGCCEGLKCEAGTCITAATCVCDNPPVTPGVCNGEGAACDTVATGDGPCCDGLACAPTGPGNGQCVNPWKQYLQTVSAEAIFTQITPTGPWSVDNGVPADGYVLTNSDLSLWALAGSIDLGDGSVMTACYAAADYAGTQEAFLNITPDEAEACKAELVQLATANNLTPVPDMPALLALLVPGLAAAGGLRRRFSRKGRK